MGRVKHRVMGAAGKKRLAHETSVVQRHQTYVGVYVPICNTPVEQKVAPITRMRQFTIDKAKIAALYICKEQHLLEIFMSTSLVGNVE